MKTKRRARPVFAGLHLSRRSFSMRKRLPYALSSALAAGTLFAATAGAQTVPARLLPFDDFLRGVSGARFETYALQAGNGVKTAQSFEEMRGHILRMYQRVTVTHSFLFGPDPFDCLPVLQQPGVRLLGLPGVAAEPPPLPRPDGLNGGAPSGPAAIRVGQLERGNTVDSLGNSVICEDGTIPMRRITLEELTRFETLQESFQKSPDAAVTDGHTWAKADQPQSNVGGSADINLWTPSVGSGTGYRFSLSQVWYVNTYTVTVNRVSSTYQQTVEGGWQEWNTPPPSYCNQRWSNTPCPPAPGSRLFIYYTPDGYGQDSQAPCPWQKIVVGYGQGGSPIKTCGCYNISCGAFVQKNKNWYLGGGFPQYVGTSQYNGGGYSAPDGTQYYFTLEYFNYGGNWWLNLNGEWVGYYPDKLFNTHEMATRAANSAYGGEVFATPPITTTTSWPQMGSGKLPSGQSSQDWKYAAFQKNIYYFSDTTHAVNASLQPYSPSPTTCYNSFPKTSDAAQWNSYVFFGGPGGTGCAPLPAAVSANIATNLTR